MKLITLTRNGILLTAIFSCSFSLSAQNGMTQEQMQVMMENAAKMQACFENLKPGVMETLEQKSTQMQKEVRTLCEAGKRDEATQKAIQFGMEMQSSPEMQELRTCGEQAAAMMAGGFSAGGPGHEGESSHVCDNL